MKFGEDVARWVNFVVGVSIEPMRPGPGAIRHRVNEFPKEIEAERR